MFTTIFDTVAVLFVIAAVFGYVNHRFIKLPFAVGLMVSGLVASLMVMGLDFVLPELQARRMAAELLSDIDFAEALMHGMLSFLLFAGALHTDMTKLKKWAGPILTLASVGVLISATIIGLGSHLAFSALGLEVPFAYCLVLGAVITPTDPVAVIGIMRQAGAPKDLEIKVIGESLFNDGIGVVLFTVLVSIAAASVGADAGHTEMTAGAIVGLIGLEVVGGVLLGLVSGFFTYLALRTIDEPNLETLISVALVMGITFVAFQIHTSAPLACVVAGLFIGNRGREDAMDADTREAVDTVWSFLDEGLNAVLFLLVGLEVLLIPIEGRYWAAAAAIIVIALAARGAAVWVPITALKLKVGFPRGTRRVLWWGGIKGGISVALAMSLPRFEGRDIILAVTYATVVASVLVQGLTIGKVVERLAPGRTQPDLPLEEE